MHYRHRFFPPAFAIIPVLAVLLAVGARAGRGENELAAWAPKEALAFVQGNDWAALDSVIRTQRVQETLNVPLDTLRAVFPGPIGFFVNEWHIPGNRNIKDLEEWAEKAKWDVCFVGRHAGDARQAQELMMKMLGPLPANAKQAQTAVGGVPVYTITFTKRTNVAVPEKDKKAQAARNPGPLIREEQVIYQFAFPKDMLVFSVGGGNATQRAILAGSSGPEGALTASPVFKSAMYGLSGGAITAYMNINAFYARLEDYLEESLGADPRGLGLHTLYCVGMTVRPVAGGSQLNVNLVSSQTPQGAVATLLPQGEAKADMHRYAPGDVISLASGKLDIAALWQTIETVIAADQPAVKVIVDAQLKLIREEKNIDVVKSVVGALSGDVLFYSTAPTANRPKGEDILTCWLKPGQNPEEALSFGLAYLGQFLGYRLGRFPDPVEGAVIWASGPEEPGGVDPFPFSFAVKGDRLILAHSPQSVATALRLKTPNDDIYNNPYFKVANPWVPQPRQIFAFSGPGSTVMSWGETARRWLVKTSSGVPALGDFVDFRRLAGLRKDVREAKIFAGATRPAPNILQLQLAVVE